MAASEALNVQGEAPPRPVDPTAVAPAAVAAAPRWPQLIPIAQLLAVVLAVFAIIWNQQQATDTLRTELRAEISSVEAGLKAEINSVETRLRAEINSVETGLRAEINSVETGLRAEINSVETGLRAEIRQLRVEVDGVETELGIQISELRAEVAENGERLARIEGFLGIGIPEAAQE